MHLHGRFTGTDTGTGGVSKVRLSADVAGSRATSGKSNPPGGMQFIHSREGPNQRATGESERHTGGTQSGR